MAKRLTIGQTATLACIWEISIPKPGNVHRGADFDDVTFNDFLTSAVVIGPSMEVARETSVGSTVLAAAEATRHWVGTNTNLGTILLLAPMASVPRDQELRSGIEVVLSGLDCDDARLVYQAIRTASPGGMGQVDQMDVAGDGPSDLIAAMRAAQHRDLVAKQYVNNFAEIFDCVIPWLNDRLTAGWSLARAVEHAHLRLMSEYPDSLIARKCGLEMATESARRARAALDAGNPGDAKYHQAIADLDFWLRSDGHCRNPGTTADFIAAGLFSLIREQGSGFRISDL